MLPPIYVQVGGRYVRLERVPRQARRYEGWTVGGAFLAGWFLAIFGVAAMASIGGR